MPSTKRIHPQANSKRASCIFCRDKHLALGLCNKHYLRKRRCRFSAKELKVYMARYTKKKETCFLRPIWTVYVKDWLLDRGMSQHTLGKAANISEGQLSRLLKGYFNPSVLTLAKLENAMSLKRGTLMEQVETVMEQVGQRLGAE